MHACMHVHVMMRMRGFSSAVLLLHPQAMRESKLYARLLEGYSQTCKGCKITLPMPQKKKAPSDHARPWPPAAPPDRLRTCAPQRRPSLHDLPHQCLAIARRLTCSCMPVQKLGWVADQTLFSLMSTPAAGGGSLFYTLPCGWNRQTSTAYLGGVTRDFHKWHRCAVAGGWRLALACVVRVARRRARTTRNARAPPRAHRVHARARRVTHRRRWTASRPLHVTAVQLRRRVPRDSRERVGVEEDRGVDAPGRERRERSSGLEELPLHAAPVRHSRLRRAADVEHGGEDVLQESCTLLTAV